MLFDKWYISDNFKHLIPWRDCPGGLLHFRWLCATSNEKRQFILINAYEGDLQTSFLPLIIPTSVVCYFTFLSLLLCLFPFSLFVQSLGLPRLPLAQSGHADSVFFFTSGACLCRVFRVSSLLLFLRQDSVCTAGYSFHLWTHLLEYTASVKFTH